MARIEADDGHVASPQGPGEEVRQQPGLQPSSNDMGRMLADCHGYGIGIGGAFPAPNQISLLINHTDRSQLLRNIQTNIM